MWDTLLDTTIDIYRATLAQDAGGGTTRTFPGTATLANIPASVQPASTREQDIWSRRNIVVDTIIYTTSDLDTLLSGGLKLQDQIQSGGVTYVVQGFVKSLNTVISSEPLYKIVCRRVI